MDNDTKILVLSVLVIVTIGVVSFSFGDVTGRVARNYDKVLSEIYVSDDPDIVDGGYPVIGKGGMVWVTIDTGSAGTSNQLGFYEHNGVAYKRRGDTLLDDNCGGASCRPGRTTVKRYQLHPSWEGEYCAGVLDKEFDEKIYACFFIR
tara:strand:+ start:83 stop:526 length:444 start_codon:yes stop_codon:yes gene_type:complete